MAAGGQPIGARVDWDAFQQTTDETIDEGARAAADTAKRVNEAVGKPAVKLAAERSMQAKAKVAFGDDAKALDPSIKAAAGESAESYASVSNQAIDAGAQASARGAKASVHGSIQVAKKFS